MSPVATAVRVVRAESPPQHATAVLDKVIPRESCAIPRPGCSEEIIGLVGN